jgi:hypothetical protein
MATPATGVQIVLAARVKPLITWVDGVGNAFYRIYQNTANDFGTATLAAFALQGAQQVVVGGLDYATDYWFWVVGEDTAGGLAAEAGPVTITTDAAPSDQLIISAIQDALYDWAYAVTNGTVVWEYGAGSKPGKPFISLNLIGPSRTGFTDSNKKLAGDLDFRQEGMRVFTVSVNVYDDDDALTWATVLQASLDNTVYIDQLQGEKIGIGDVGGVTDLSQLLETKYERRARFEFVIFKAYNEEYTLDVIEDVTVENNIL